MGQNRYFVADSFLCYMTVGCIIRCFRRFAVGNSALQLVAVGRPVLAVRQADHGYMVPEPYGLSGWKA
jgi:hypothetical protein